MKTCFKCGAEHDLKQKGSYCLVCRRIYGATWRNKHRNKINEAARIWRQANKSSLKAAQQKYRRKHAEKLRIKRKERKYSRDFHLRKNYGISEEQYCQMVVNQGGLCLLCQKKRKRRLDVDHDHNTSEVRGLLCQNCNRLLGWANDDTDVLERAIQYLKYGADNMSLNKVVLVGRLGKDPEVRYTKNGKAVVDFTMATDDYNGQEKQTEWHSVIAWDKTAENVGKFLKKGSLVAVDGRLQTRKWDKNGQTQYKTEVVATAVKFLDKTSGADSKPIAKPAAKPQTQEIPDDDIPF